MLAKYFYNTFPEQASRALNPPFRKGGNKYNYSIELRMSLTKSFNSHLVI